MPVPDMSMNHNMSAGDGGHVVMGGQPQIPGRQTPPPGPEVTSPSPTPGTPDPSQPYGHYGLMATPENQNGPTIPPQQQQADKETNDQLTERLRTGEVQGDGVWPTLQRGIQRVSGMVGDVLQGGAADIVNADIDVTGGGSHVTPEQMGDLNNARDWALQHHQSLGFRDGTSGEKLHMYEAALHANSGTVNDMAGNAQAATTALGNANQNSGWYDNLTQKVHGARTSVQNAGSRSPEAHPSIAPIPQTPTPQPATPVAPPVTSPFAAGGSFDQMTNSIRTAGQAAGSVLNAATDASAMASGLKPNQ